MIKKSVLLLVIVFIFSSCVSRKKMAYFQNISEATSEKIYELKLQPDDLLQITVNAPAPNPELAAPFNLATTSDTSTDAKSPSATGGGGMSYSIDNKGFIVMPLVGSLKLSGLTHDEALALLNKEIGKFITNPIVSLRILNFKVTVLGEVMTPGSYSVAGERLTLPEALGLAGDLKLTGLRNNIMVIREIDGKRTFSFVDITKADFMNSDYYYLMQNDLVVVEPNKSQMNSSVIGRDLTIGISAATLVLTIVALITR